jgi:hypothetical protein
MYHKSCPQPTSTGNHRIASRTTAREPTPKFLHNGWPARIVDGAVNTATARQALICGVDDGVHLLLGDIALNQFKDRMLK